MAARGRNSVLDAQTAAEKAVSVIGFGYDFTSDLRLSACKSTCSGSSLIELDLTRTKDLVVPGNLTVSNVSSSIKCDKGDRIRFSSDALTFNQMSELFNHGLCLSGKIPSGLFNAMFYFKGPWQKDASETKILAFDGWLIGLYTIELERSQMTLRDEVKKEVPSTCDPLALAEFIEKYGTHIIVGVKMGGKDLIHIKQLQSSSLEPTEVRKFLKKLADERFCEDGSVSYADNTDMLSAMLKEPSIADHQLSSRRRIDSCSTNNDLLAIHVRRGGLDSHLSHKQWLSTVTQYPNVVSLSLVPIGSLLGGIKGAGFLSQAINLYLRYKPPLEELAQFLQYQLLPQQWAPAFSDLPLGPAFKKNAYPCLQFRPLGPKLYVNTVKVDTGNRPVTGVRLFLEGKRNNYLGIHLQHLSTCPLSLKLSPCRMLESQDEHIERAYFVPVNWSIFSHICTSPVEYLGAQSSDPACIVTKSQFEVKVIGMKNVLFLRLGFSEVESAQIRRSVWDGANNSASKKSGLSSLLMSSPFSAALNQQPDKLPKQIVNSAVYPGGPPSPSKAPKMSYFVDTKEVVRGPEDSPGHWVVTGAKLCVENGMVRVRVKFSLLTITSEDSVSV